MSGRAECGCAEHGLIEKALRDSEARFRRIVETAHEGIWEMDAQGCTVFINAQMASMLGYSRDEMMGQPVVSFLPEEEHADFQASIEARRRGESGVHEHCYLTKDGRKIWTLVSTTPQFASDGTFDGCFAMVSDITERKEMEEALRKSELRYRQVSSLVSDYAYAFAVGEGHALSVDWMTEGFERITGYTVKEFDAHGGWEGLIHPDDMPIAVQRFEHLLAGKEDISEFRIMRRDGQVRWLRDCGEPVWDDELGRVVRIYGAARDITERKLAEDALTQERFLLRAVIDNIPSTIYVKDTEGRKLLSNRADWTAMGVDSEEKVLGKTDFDLYPAEKAERYHANDQRVFESGQPLPNLEDSRISDKGQRKWVVTSKAPLKNAKGIVVGLVGIEHDITERKLAEEALRESEARYCRLAEHAPDLIYRVELVPEQRFTYVSPAATAIAGYTPEEHYADPNLGYKLCIQMIVTCWKRLPRGNCSSASH